MRSTKLIAGVVAGCAMLVLFCWRAKLGSDESEHSSRLHTARGTQDSEPHDESSQQDQAPSVESRREAFDRPVPAPSEEVAHEEAQVKSESDLASSKQSPHPETEQRSAMYQSRASMESARQAARAGDVVRLREILESRVSAPTEEVARHVAEWRQAYGIVLGCLESVNAGAQAAGAKFVDENAGSPLRREVRRYCQIE